MTEDEMDRLADKVADRLDGRRRHDYTYPQAPRPLPHGYGHPYPWRPPYEVWCGARPPVA